MPESNNDWIDSITKHWGDKTFLIDLLCEQPLTNNYAVVLVRITNGEYILFYDYSGTHTAGYLNLESEFMMRMQRLKTLEA